MQCKNCGNYHFDQQGKCTFCGRLVEADVKPPIGWGMDGLQRSTRGGVANKKPDVTEDDRRKVGHIFSLRQCSKCGEHSFCYDETYNQFKCLNRDCNYEVKPTMQITGLCQDCLYTNGNCGDQSYPHAEKCLGFVNRYTRFQETKEDKPGLEARHYMRTTAGLAQKEEIEPYPVQRAKHQVPEGRGTRQSGHRPREAEVSWLWWVLPIFCTWLGGLIGYLVLKDKNPRKAKAIAWLGFLMLPFWFLVRIVLYG